MQQDEDILDTPEDDVLDMPVVAYTPVDSATLRTTCEGTFLGTHEEWTAVA